MLSFLIYLIFSAVMSFPSLSGLKSLLIPPITKTSELFGVLIAPRPMRRE